jgi:hypothetical protein
MAFQELGASSADGKSAIAVIAHRNDKNQPSVLIIIRKDSDGVFDTTLDGRPAIAISLGEASAGNLNAPWELGHLLAQKWEEAKNLP